MKRRKKPQAIREKMLSPNFSVMKTFIGTYALLFVVAVQLFNDFSSILNDCALIQNVFISKRCWKRSSNRITSDALFLHIFWLFFSSNFFSYSFLFRFFSFSKWHTLEYLRQILLNQVLSLALNSFQMNMCTKGERKCNHRMCIERTIKTDAELHKFKMGEKKNRNEIALATYYGHLWWL